MNKKIILSLAVIGVVAAIAVGGTVAYFSDTETSTGNTFTAGSIDLKVDLDRDGQHIWDLKDLAAGDLIFNYNDIKPGDNGEATVSLHVDNNPAWVCMDVENIANAENGCTEPETADDLTCGASSTDPGVGLGELQNALKFTVWRDIGGQNATACDNILQDGEPIIYEDRPAKNKTIAIADSQTVGGPLPGETTYCIGISWDLPSDTGNIVQSDSVSGDISFYAVQSKNNGSFVCSATR